MKRAALALLMVLVLAISAAAQNKFSGSAKCAKPDMDYKIEVGDQPGHVFDIMKAKCTYTKGEVAGVQIKEEVDTVFYEISKDAAHGRFSGVMNMTNGDKAYIRGESTLALKAGAPQTDVGKWSFSGGTGKLKGLKGKGTYKANIATDETATLEVEGEYELAK